MKGKFGILLAGGFLVLSAISAATGNFFVRLDVASKETQQTTATANTATIAIQRVALASAPATAFGQFQARSSVIAPGTPFNIYIEPTNLATRFENGQVRASMSIDILVRNAQGQTVAVQDNAWQLPITRPSAGPAQLTQVYGSLTVNHLTFPEGRYQIVLRVHDDNSGAFVDQTIDVELRAQAAQNGPRLSQSAGGNRTQ
jgi:hypothetical protein